MTGTTQNKQEKPYFHCGPQAEKPIKCTYYYLRKGVVVKKTMIIVIIAIIVIKIKIILVTTITIAIIKVTRITNSYNSNNSNDKSINNNDKESNNITSSILVNNIFSHHA